MLQSGRVGFAELAEKSSLHRIDHLCNSTCSQGCITLTSNLDRVPAPSREKTLPLENFFFVE